MDTGLSHCTEKSVPLRKEVSKIDRAVWQDKQDIQFVLLSIKTVESKISYRLRAINRWELKRNLSDNAAVRGRMSKKVASLHAENEEDRKQIESLGRLVLALEASIKKAIRQKRAILEKLKPVKLKRKKSISNNTFAKMR